MTNQISSTTVSAIDSACFKRMIEAGLAWFERHYQIVNDLNVYPVPDGDTGTNMMLTLREAHRKMNESADGVKDRALALANGAINGSKGNSGTLMSQMFDGFARSLNGSEVIDAAALAKGFRQAVQAAYKALQNPVEGTILTVAREIAEEVEAAAAITPDLKKILERIVERGTASVAHTPELLPKLKQAGVVDSGGRGLLYFFEGMLRVARGESLPMALQAGALPTPSSAPSSTQRAMHDVLKADDERGYGYDVQYVVRGQALDVDKIRLDIAAMGDSMVVVGDESRVKVHIHVHDPGVPISYGVHLGVISEVVIENMQDQFEVYVERHAYSAPSVEIEIGEDDIAVIAVAPGDGLARVFKDTGAAATIGGGQGANPSVADFLAAMESVEARKFILLPNNKNVVLTAELAAKQALKVDKQVTVVPTTSVPQGLAAMYAFSPHGKLDEVTAAMIESYPTITTGEVTQATRTVQLDEVHVKEGQYIGLVNGKLVIATDELRPLLLGLLERMEASSAEIITLYYGEMVTEIEARDVAAWLSHTLSRDGLPEFHVHYGGQPYYEYVLSAE